MNIYITGTPLVSPILIDQVITILNKVKGPFEFHRSEMILPNQKYSNPEVNLEDDTSRIMFMEMNEVANEERMKHKITHDHFFVILTSHKLDIAYQGKNWFSYFTRRNIFVRTYGWEEHTPKKVHIAIAHQIVENMFQSLSGYRFEEYGAYHLRAKGCINDFCKNEYEIEFKLRAGHICKSCLDVAVNNGTSIEQIDQISRLLNVFRDELLDFKSVIEEMGIPNMKIKENGDIYIGDTFIDIDYIHATFYIFAFLHRGEEISIQYLRDNIDQFRNIYFSIKKTGSDKAVLTFMGLEYDSNGNQISKKEKGDMMKYIRNRREKIKTKIKEAVGLELAELFKIGSFYKFDWKRNKHHYCTLPINDRVKIEIEPGLLELME